MTKATKSSNQSNHQKRTKFLLECLKVCFDADKFELKFDTCQNLMYFCNAAEILGYDYKEDKYKEEYSESIEFFDELYKYDAQKYIIENKSLTSKSETGDHFEYQLEDYLSIGGYFGGCMTESNQEHRLIAIAFAVAVSETEE